MFWKKTKPARSAEDYGKDYAAAVAKNDPRAAQAIVAEAMKSSEASELQLSLLAMAIYEGQARFCFPDFIFALSARYPDSIYPFQPLAAYFLSQGKGDFDGGAIEARLYLRRVKEAGLLKKEKPGLVNFGLTMAALTVANLYTEVGARSYSLRIFSYLLNPAVALDEQSLAVLQWQTQSLHRELKEPAQKELDKLWEDFFRTGSSHVGELISHCREKNAEYLARRLDIIAGSVQFGATDVLNFETELFLNYASQNKPDGSTLQGLF